MSVQESCIIAPESQMNLPITRLFHTHGRAVCRARAVVMGVLFGIESVYLSQLTGGDDSPLFFYGIHDLILATDRIAPIFGVHRLDLGPRLSLLWSCYVNVLSVTSCGEACF